MHSYRRKQAYTIVSGIQIKSNEGDELTELGKTIPRNLDRIRLKVYLLLILIGTGVLSWTSYAVDMNNHVRPSYRRAIDETKDWKSIYERTLKSVDQLSTTYSERQKKGEASKQIQHKLDSLSEVRSKYAMKSDSLIARLKWQEDQRNHLLGVNWSSGAGISIEGLNIGFSGLPILFCLFIPLVLFALCWDLLHISAMTNLLNDVALGSINSKRAKVANILYTKIDIFFFSGPRYLAEVLMLTPSILSFLFIAVIVNNRMDIEVIDESLSCAIYGHRFIDAIPGTRPVYLAVVVGFCLSVVLGSLCLIFINMIDQAISEENSDTKDS